MRKGDEVKVVAYGGGSEVRDLLLGLTGTVVKVASVFIKVRITHNGETGDWTFLNTELEPV